MTDSATTASTSKNPRRVAAGRRNRQLRGPLTDEGRQRLREAAKRNRPWRYSTGPKTATGKAKVALNGLKRQTVPGPSVRQMRHEMAGAGSLMNQMAELRKMLAG